MNPLLDFTGLPRFAEIRPEHVTPAVDALLAENRALIERLTASADAPDWESFAAPLEDANERLSRAWGQVSHLHSVMDSPELREAYNANLPKIAQYYADLGQNEALYAKFKALAAAPGGPPEGDRERGTGFPPWRRRAARGAQGAFQGHPGGIGGTDHQVRGEPSRRYQRFRSLRGK